MKQQFIRDFAEIGATDVPLVGGKNASLGEMYRSSPRWVSACRTASRSPPTPIGTPWSAPASSESCTTPWTTSTPRTWTT